MIAEDQPEEAIRDLSYALEEFELPRKYENALFLLRNHFNRLKKERVLQLSDVGEYHVENNKLLKQLLDFIDEVADWVKEHRSNEPSSNKNSTNINEGGITSPFLKATAIEKRYDDFKLGPVDITLYPGKICALFGSNGSGKSTFLNIVAGLVKQNNGTLEYFGKQVTDWYELKTQIGYIPQQLQEKDIDLIDLLKYKCITHNIPPQELDYYVQDVITKLNLSSAIHKPWNTLSGGFRMRVELACTLVWRPSILILDEPLANLDIITQQHFIDDLLKYARSKTKPIAILLTSQHIEILENKVDEIIFLHEGHVDFVGTSQQLSAKAFMNQLELEIRENSALQEPILFLEQHVQNINARKEGSRYFIKMPKEITIQSVIQELLTSGYEVTYFKDVTASVRKLFNYE